MRFKLLLYRFIAPLTTLLLINAITGAAFANSILQQIEQEFGKIVGKVNPAVVEVIATGEIIAPDIDKLDEETLNRLYGWLFEDTSQKLRSIPKKRYPQKNIGSGIIIDEKGHIVTTYSVIHNASDILVSLADSRKLKAQLVGADEKTDIAVIKVKAKKLPVVQLGDSDNVKMADWVVTVARAYGKMPEFAFAIVSGVEPLPNGPIYNAIRLNASVNPGNIGGAVVNTSGQLIGMIGAALEPPGYQPPLYLEFFSKESQRRSKKTRISPSSKLSQRGMFHSESMFTGFKAGFAIPSNMVDKIAKELILHGEVQRGWLGVGVKQFNSKRGELTGVRVFRLAKNGPAAKAGIKQGDVIVKFNDNPIRTVRSFQRFVTSSSPNTKAQLNFVRNRQNLTVYVVFSKSPHKKRANRKR